MNQDQGKELTYMSDIFIDRLKNDLVFRESKKGNWRDYESFKMNIRELEGKFGYLSGKDYRKLIELYCDIFEL